MKRLFLFLLICVTWGCGQSTGSDQAGITQSTGIGGSTAKGALSGTGDVPAGSIAPNAKVVDAEILYPFSEGIAVIEKGGAHALIDKSGNMKIPFNKYVFGAVQGDYWEDNGRFHSGRSWPGFHRGQCLAGIKSKGEYGNDVVLWGTINVDTQVVVPLKHVRLQKQNGELLFFEDTQSKLVCYDRAGHPVTYAETINVAGFENGFNKYRNMANVTPYQYKGEKVLVVQAYLPGTGWRYGLFNFAGEAITKMAFEQIDIFSEGLAAFRKNDDFGRARWGFINTKGDVVIPPTFTNQPGNFHCGLALVQPSDANAGFSYAFIEETGNIKIRLQNDDGWSRYLLDFRNGLVVNTSRNGYMDTNGKLYTLSVINGSYTDPVTGQLVSNLHNTRIFDHSENRFFRPDQILFSHNQKKGLTDINGHLLVPPIFDELSLFDAASGLAHAVIQNPVNGQRINGYINTKGVFVLIKSNDPTW